MGFDWTRVHLCRPADTSFVVFVKTLIGKTLCLTATPQMSVAHFKKLIEKKEGSDIAPEMMRLTFAGAQMEDNKTMAHHGISHESTIHLCLRLLGGMYHATSGRQDNTELQGGVSNATAGSRRQTKTEMVAEPLTHTEVTVVVPGQGEVQLEVPLDDSFTGEQLMELLE